ncbi:hypothetical protein Tco_1405271, partial [Tanacetum coccineum]
NIVTNKESLWVRWIHSYKLRGRSFWAISLNDADMRWGWSKLLQIRDLVRPYIWTKLGNGNRASAWYDTYDLQGPLIKWISPRDISREGFTLTSMVSDLFLNFGGVWPQEWLRKMPNIGLIQMPNLLSGLVWMLVSYLEDMDTVSLVFQDILLYIHPIAKKQTAKSMFGKLIMAATSYYVWIERNKRLFKNVKRSLEELRDLIMVTVSLKIMTFRFKNTTNVVRLLERWKMPRIFRLYGTMLLNLDQLEKHLAKEEFQELESFNAFRHMEYLKESSQERAKHKREYDKRMNDRKMQSKEGKVDSSKALDAGLAGLESKEIESDEHVTSMRSRMIHMLRMQLLNP